MTRICVATFDGHAYYAIVSRLRKAGFQFLSMLPSDRSDGCELALTTRKEAPLFRGRVMVVEELDDDSDVVRGQIVSRLAGGGGTLVIGVDPGLRTGMAAFYGEARLASHTYSSRERLCTGVVNLIEKVGSARSLIRIGNGDPSIANWFATRLIADLPNTAVEIVDESGTSLRSPRAKGMQTDQSAAAKIALRKGALLRAPGHPLRKP
jgi:hypothetical protein